MHTAGEHGMIQIVLTALPISINTELLHHMVNYKVQNLSCLLLQLFIILDSVE